MTNYQNINILHSVLHYAQGFSRKKKSLFFLNSTPKMVPNVWFMNERARLAEFATESIFMGKFIDNKVVIQQSKRNINTSIKIILKVKNKLFDSNFKTRENINSSVELYS